MSGYVTPTGTAPLYDSALDAVLQAAVVGVTGLTNVRPRWQPLPPNQLAATVDWCAIGVTSTPSNLYQASVFELAGTPTETMTQEKQEALEVMCTFYGPNAHANAALLRDGLQFSYNLSTLESNGLALQTLGTIMTVPELINSQWVRAANVQLTFHRVVERQYVVEEIHTVPVQVTYDSGIVTQGTVT